MERGGWKSKKEADGLVKDRVTEREKWEGKISHRKLLIKKIKEKEVVEMEGRELKLATKAKEMRVGEGRESWRKFWQRGGRH